MKYKIRLIYAPWTDCRNSAPFFLGGTEGKETNLIKWFMLSQGQSNVIILRWLSMYTTPWHFHLWGCAQFYWHNKYQLGHDNDNLHYVFFLLNKLISLMFMWPTIRGKKKKSEYNKSLFWFSSCVFDSTNSSIWTSPKYPPKKKLQQTNIGIQMTHILTLVK